MQTVSVTHGTLAAALLSNYETLQQNLGFYSPWPDIIEGVDDPSRTNSPYYAPATQFIIDSCLDIVRMQPELLTHRQTPYDRADLAGYLIKNLVTPKIMGEHGMLALAYDDSVIAGTEVHARRRHHLLYDHGHVALGAHVPFDDVASVAGGAALMLHEAGALPKQEIVAATSASKNLHIVAGIGADEGINFSNTLGYPYVRGEFYDVQKDGTVAFNQAALNAIKPLLSTHGCPTGRIRSGGMTLFEEYWQKLNEYLLTGFNAAQMQRERVVLSGQVTPANDFDKMFVPVKSKPAGKTGKPRPKANSRYTPPKNKR